MRAWGERQVWIQLSLQHSGRKIVEDTRKNSWCKVERGNIKAELGCILLLQRPGSINHRERGAVAFFNDPGSNRKNDTEGNNSVVWS